MLRRHEITDYQWDAIKDLLPGKESDPGATAKDNRLFVNAVMWIAKTGAPWRDLPERFGNWNSVFQRFNRWCKSGVFQSIMEKLEDPDLGVLLLGCIFGHLPLCLLELDLIGLTPGDKHIQTLRITCARTRICCTPPAMPATRTILTISCEFWTPSCAC